MKTLMSILDHFLGYFERAEAARRDAYLAKSTNIQDLEMRMREFERSDSPFGRGGY